MTRPTKRPARYWTKQNLWAKKQERRRAANIDAQGKSNNGKQPVAGLAETDAAYLKYDFVPGNEVIFEDDLKGERLGEFPSKWDLMEVTLRLPS
jgi:hypothetical protein